MAISTIELPPRARRVDPTTLDDLLSWGEAVVENLSGAGDYVECAVLLFDEAADALRLVGARGCVWPSGVELVPGDTLDPSLDTVCGWAYRSGRPALVGDARRVDGEARDGSTRPSQLAVPVTVEGRTVGVVAVSGSLVGQFGIRDVDALKGLADDAAAALVERGLC